MQTVSIYDLLMVGRKQKISLHVYIDGELLDTEVDRCEYAPSCGDDSVFSIGNACAACITITLSGAFPQLKGHAVQVKWSVLSTQYPLFTGKVEEAIVRAGKTTVEAWDEMYYSGSELFTSTSGTIPADEAFAQVAEAMGVEVDWYSTAALSLSGIWVSLANMNGKYTNSAMAGYIAALVGANAVISRAGKLVVCDLVKADWSTEPYEGGAEAENEDFTISGVSFLRDETDTTLNEDGTSSESDRVMTFSAGDGSMMVSNPLGCQEAAIQAFQALEGLSFRPGSYTFPGYILLEPGDLFTVNSMDGSYTVAAMKLSMSIDGGVKTTVSAGGAVKSGGGAGTINQALKALEADFARLRYLVAENAEIVSAKITSLRVEDIVAGRIQSTDFQTAELEKLYPAKDLYPFDTVYPNNGEEIIRGIEIDFSRGIIRGVFYSDVIENLTGRIESLEDANIGLMERIEGLEKAQSAPLYPLSITNVTKEET